MIIAGGTGRRTMQNTPKQFIKVNDKEVIAYTLEKFQRHPMIDRIAVVCVEGYEDTVSSCAEKYGITRLKHLIPGGETAQESIRNGLFELEKEYDGNDLVVIHDAVRPMVSEEIITDCIRKAEQFGIAMAAMPCADAMFTAADGLAESEYPREHLYRTQRPHCFRLGEACRIHRTAIQENIQNATCTAAIAAKLGYKIALSSGSETNLKLTTVEDVRIFEALLFLDKQNA